MQDFSNTHMKILRTLSLLTAFLLCHANLTHAQSKKKLRAIYEDVEVYVGIKKYENNVEKRQKTVFIDTETGSFVFIVIQHKYPVFFLPGGDYRYKIYRQQGKSYVLDGTYESTFESATQLRAKISIKKTGNYLIEAYRGKDFKIGEVSLEVKPQRST